MKLFMLYEANFVPRLDSKQALKHGIAQQEVDHKKQYPARSGGIGTPPSNPKHRKLMGIDNEHETMSQNKGRPESQHRPTPVDSSFKDLGQPYERGVLDKPVGSSDDGADPLNISQEKDGYSITNGPAQDHGRERSNSPSMKRPQPNSFGKRYR